MIFCITVEGLNSEDEIWINEKSQKVRDKWEKAKKSCLYNYDLKHIYGKHLIAKGNAVQNSTDPIDIVRFMKDRTLVEPVNDLGLDKKSSPILYTNNESDFDGNKEKQKDNEYQRLDNRQKQKILHAPNARYFDS